MLIFDRAVVYELAVLAARGDHRNLAIEIDERFEHCFLLADGAPGLGRAIGRIDSKLTLAVVAERGGFQHRRAAQIGERAVQAFERTHLAIRRCRQAGIREERFFADALLRGVQNRSAGTDGRATGGGLGRGRRNIFELECYYADVAREIGDRVQIVVGRLYFQVGHLAGGRVLVGR